MGSYLQNQNGVFYFRRKVPASCIKVLDKSEIKRSLRTGCRRLAKIRAAELYLVTENLFERVKMKKSLSLKALNTFATSAFLNDIQGWEESLSSLPGGLGARRNEFAQFLKLELNNQVQCFQNNDFIYGENYIEPYLNAIGVEKLSLDETLDKELRSKLIRLFHRGQIATIQTMIARVKGDFSFRPQDKLFAIAMDQFEAGEIDLVSASEPLFPEEMPHEDILKKSPVEYFSEIYPRAIQFMQENGEWKGQTVSQNRTTFARFVEISGDKPANEYQRSDIAGFLNLIRKLPRDWGRSKANGNLTLKQILKKFDGKEYETLALNTLKRHHRALSKLFTHMLNEGIYEGTNPASGYKFPKDSLKRNKRQTWSTENLMRLFGSPVWQGAKSKSSRSKVGKIVIKDEKYWLPLLALFQGNRLEEFAQLRKIDIKTENDIHYFYVHGAGDRQIKNEQSERKIPIHPFIQKLGFLDYVNQTTETPESMVFPNLKPGGADKKYGFSFTKWFSRYRQDIGVFEKGMDYHSFRHGFVTQLRNKDVDKDIVERLVGHDSGESTNSSVYLKEFELRKLFEAISLLEWPEVDELFE